MKVGVHHGSVLSPPVHHRARLYPGSLDKGLPFELLHADDLVLIAETERLLKEKIKNWKVGMEEKGLRLRVNKIWD